MSFNSHKIAAAALALMAVLAVAAGGALAAPTTITSDANSLPGEPTSTIDSSTVIDPFNGSSDVTESIVFNTSKNDTAPAGVMLARNDTGQVVLDQDATNVTPSSLGEAADEQWRLNFTHADLNDLERDAGENVTVDVMLVNDSSADYANQSWTNFTIDVQNDNSTAIAYIEDGSPDTDVEEEEGGFLTTLGFGEDDLTNFSEVESDAVGVDGSSTDVYVVYGDDDTASTFSESLDKTGTFSLLSSETEDGDFLKFYQASVGGTPTAVYKSSAPDYLDDSNTYATSATVDGMEATQINLGDAYEDEDEVDITTSGNQKWGFGATYGMNGYSTLGQYGLAMTSTGVVA